MGAEYPPGTVFEAEDLYCVDRLPMRIVSERAGVPESTLWRWADSYDWKSKREEIRKAQSSIRANTIRLRARLIEECLGLGASAPMAVFAAAKMEEVAQAAQKLALEERELQPIDVAALRPLSTPDEAAAALEEALTLKMSMLLRDPAALDLRAVTNIRSALEMVGEMRAKAAAVDKKAEGKGLSENTGREIRKLLGILDG